MTDVAATPGPARVRKHDVALVAIGASLGGLDALQTCVSGLDPDAPAAWLVTLHIDGHRSVVDQILQRTCRLPVHQALGFRTIVAGAVSIAPPDHHLIVADGWTMAARGPRENWARPAIDPMFRSAARAYGPRVIGVVLTGRLNDGTAGMREIKQRGGLTVVQEPRDAFCSEMPASVLRHVAVDHRATIADLPQLLNGLVWRMLRERGADRAAEGGRVDGRKA